jgi:7,8-dihydroneopterin aldolase/epimerase/oxygenase
MTDRIVLANMRFDGHHGFSEAEREMAQPFEVDVELMVDLEPAGATDDLDRSVDYATIYPTVKRIVESTSSKLLETIAESIGRAILVDPRVDQVVVRVRKPQVQLGGPLDYAGVEISRRRPTTDDRD